MIPYLQNVFLNRCRFQLYQLRAHCTCRLIPEFPQPIVVTFFPISRAADRILGCSVRLRYTLGSALTNSPSDTYFALPVHLPLYHRQLLFLKNSP